MHRGLVKLVSEIFSQSLICATVFKLVISAGLSKLIFLQRTEKISPIKPLRCRRHFILGTLAMLFLFPFDIYTFFLLPKEKNQQTPIVQDYYHFKVLFKTKTTCRKQFVIPQQFYILNLENENLKPQLNHLFKGSSMIKPVFFFFAT